MREKDWFTKCIVFLNNLIVHISTILITFTNRLHDIFYNNYQICYHQSYLVHMWDVNVLSLDVLWSNDFENDVFVNINVLIILEFDSSCAWMPKIDAYLTAWMLRILEGIRPACGFKDVVDVNFGHFEWSFSAPCWNYPHV